MFFVGGLSRGLNLWAKTLFELKIPVPGFWLQMHVLLPGVPPFSCPIAIKTMPVKVTHHVEDGLTRPMATSRCHLERNPRLTTAWLCLMFGIEISTVAPVASERPKLCDMISFQCSWQWPENARSMHGPVRCVLPQTLVPLPLPKCI